MTKIIKSDPFFDIVSVRDTMDRMLDNYFGRSPIAFEGYGIVDLDMYQTENEVVIEASIPGVDPEDINISVAGEVLTIKGEVKEEKETKNADYHIKERRYGSFSRSITLPTQILTEKANADFKNGILKLTLPKAEEVKPKTITVKAK
ncbi:MAG: Hsp20/alpha crystallin family protein [Anaerolineaceae bacterium]|jgi:HSP20 family protein|nr:MAG: Hsp20/alpha crystallin family protein [Anaerolineaceae bacterium]